ncbi:signal transduction histidine kinase [Paenibacillus castaneae]|uniref:sensor histidine kinase n=1 Tax=Paenibacillus castaneae TaxID=474957 RepID=UPI000C9A5B32|nr:HAMP domain-containing sensor histidine kinase [Paenibacillus castaneae]NIK78159.1 signal transduction histidine kinase [Paenibacillus castaneae]
MSKLKQWRSRRIKFRQTLLSRYLLIILFAFLFIPIIFPLASIIYIILNQQSNNHDTDYLKYGSTSALTAMLYEEAAKLDESAAPQIDRKLNELKEQYPDASFFWVDASGTTRLQLPQQKKLPQHWTPADAIQFMKDHVDSDPFTVVAFIGPNKAGPAFIVLQVPRSITRQATPVGSGTPFYIAFLFIMFAFFVLLSLLFFRHIRKRLLQLQIAMTIQGEDGLPVPIKWHKEDEIGQLEAAFNDMVSQLRESKERERAEEELRKSLIANLSHDLRTPLTVMNSHLYSLRNESLSAAGQAAVKQMELKIASVGSLMENLLSYTLMTSGRYPLKLEQHDVLRLVRESAAAWYPLWEQEGIDADIDLKAEKLLWNVDKEGFRRVLDNLFQNVVRHAASGQYIRISTGEHHSRTALVISDRGGGLNTSSSSKGAGIGLAIVDYLIHEMQLDWQTDSSESGMRITIFPK